MTSRELLGEALHRLPARLHALVPVEQRDDLRHWLGRFNRWEEGAELAPAPPPAGTRPGPPDFVGVGAQLCGTAWWAGLVGAHPSVTGTPGGPMGTHYLSHFCTRPFGATQIGEYHGWFPRRPGTIAGEWTPGYLSEQWVPSLLALAAPETRIVVMVRNPVERLRLGLAHTFERRVPSLGTTIADAVDRGFYAEHLRRFRDAFPADRILVLQYEQCVVDTGGQLEATFGFLGADTATAGTSAAPRRRSAPLPPLDADTTRRMAAVYADDVADLARQVPTLDLALWPEFAE